MLRSAVAVLLAACAVVFLAVAGCRSFLPAAQAVGAAPAVLAQQLIVKFKPGTLNCDAESIARFSHDLRVPLEFVRAMSGDACVVSQTAAGQDDLEQGRETLRRHPAVEWLERDARMKAH